MKRLLLLGALAIAFLLGVVVMKSRCKCRWQHTADVEYVFLADESTIMFPHAATMARLVGDDWGSQELFYKIWLGVLPDGRPASFMVEFWQPLAKGQPVLVASGGKWDRIPCSLFSLRSGKQWLLTFDPVHGALEAKEVKAPGGRPLVQPDGTLRFDPNAPRQGSEEQQPAQGAK